MVWKQEYADNRKFKYHNDPVERAKRLSYGRKPEENRIYMDKYYKENKDKWKVKDKDERNRKRREYYRKNEAHRLNCIKLSKEYCQKNPLKAIERMFRKYGLTIEDYKNMLAEQNNGCAICGHHFSDVQTLKNRLFVDHCHSTGKVRGLLCSECNFGISKFKDNPKIIMSAYKYIKKSLQENISMFETIEETEL